MLLEVIFFALIFGTFAGGKLFRLNDVKMRGSGLIFAALVTQMGLPIVARVSPTAAFPILILSFSALLIALLLNKKTPAVIMMSTGVFLNLLVIAANKGMPVRASAIPVAAADVIHIRMSAATRFPWLADVISWPLPGPLSGIVSLGDLFLSAGVFILIFDGMIYRGRRRAR